VQFSTQRTCPRGLLLVLAAILVSTHFGFAGEARKPAETQSGDSIAQGLLAISDVVLQHHIDPPTRQQMLLMGIKAALNKEELPQPHGLSRTVSSLARKQLVEFIGDAVTKSALSAPEFEAEFLTGMLSTVPGNASILPMNEVKVAEQLQSNRYVGIGIALATDQDRQLPMINRVFPGGPAANAEAQDRDLILEVDGADTHRMPLNDVVDLLRGPEGTSVTIVVQQPDSDETRTLEMTRGVVPIASVEARHATLGELPVGFVRIESIRSSTVHELRQIERSMHAEGARAVVLDFRRVQGGRQHDSLLLADALLDGGDVGRVLSADGTREYQAQTDSLFNGWPLAVLVDESTSGGAEWVAAALQDNGRATIFGQASAGGGRVWSPIAIPGRDESIRLLTGVLQRADGTSLVKPTQQSAQPAHPPRPVSQVRFARRSRTNDPVGSFEKLFHSLTGVQYVDAMRKSQRWHVVPDRIVTQSSRGKAAEDRAVQRALEDLRTSLQETE